MTKNQYKVWWNIEFIQKELCNKCNQVSQYHLNYRPEPFNLKEAKWWFRHWWWQPWGCCKKCYSAANWQDNLIKKLKKQIFKLEQKESKQSLNQMSLFNIESDELIKLKKDLASLQHGINQQKEWEAKYEEQKNLREFFYKKWEKIQLNKH